LHGELLIKSLPHPVSRGRTFRLVHPCQTQVSGDQATVAHNLAGNPNRRPVEVFQTILETYSGKLVAAGVKRERLQYFTACLAKLDVKFA